MRAVIQRVSHGSVTVENKKIGEISHGLVVLLGVDISDNEGDISWLVNKIINLRIFEDEKKLMNNSLINMDGDLMETRSVRCPQISRFPRRLQPTKNLAGIEILGPGDANSGLNTKRNRVCYHDF